MHERDRPVSERVSLLDRPSTALDAPADPERFLAGSGVERDSLRLAIADGDIRLYIGSAGSEQLFVVLRTTMGGGALGSMRWVLPKDGAIVLGASSITCGIVADDVISVEVDGLQRRPSNNAFLFPRCRGTASCRVLTSAGWGDVPPLPALD